MTASPTAPSPRLSTSNPRRPSWPPGPSPTPTPRPGATEPLAGEPVDLGVYQVKAVFASSEPDFTGAEGTGQLTIASAAAPVTLSNLEQTYDGTPRSVAATTDPAGLPVTLTYDGSPTPPTNAGIYLVQAVVNDPSYAGSTSGWLRVNPATLDITAAYDEKTYDGTIASDGIPLVAGLLGTDQASADSLSQSFAWPDVGTGSVDLVVDPGYLVLDGNQGDNYTVVTHDTPGVIAPADPTVTVSGYSGPYDGEPHRATGTATGVNGEDLSAGLKRWTHLHRRSRRHGRLELRQPQLRRRVGHRRYRHRCSAGHHQLRCRESRPTL